MYVCGYERILICELSVNTIVCERKCAGIKNSCLNIFGNSRTKPFSEITQKLTFDRDIYVNDFIYI
uniref:Uncharacterized protein n=1 Tax=Octopus bimaculoides TaxID=37653 RepID=A0A0L8G1E0_OCTBM